MESQPNEDENNNNNVKPNLKKKLVNDPKPVIFSESNRTLTFTTKNYKPEATSSSLVFRSLMNGRFLLTKDVRAVFIWRHEKNHTTLAFIEGIEENNGKANYILRHIELLSGGKLNLKKYIGEIEEKSEKSSVKFETGYPVEWDAFTDYKQQGFGMTLDETESFSKELMQSPIFVSSSGSNTTISSSSSSYSRTVDYHTMISEVIDEPVDSNKYWEPIEELEKKRVKNQK